jgi:hypothetical protein
MVPLYPLSGIEKIKNEFSLKKREEFFSVFNDFFQLEFMFFELSFIKSRKLFKYVFRTNEIIRQFFKKELKIDIYPKLGIELLVNKKMIWKNILELEKKYGIKVTSLHSPFDFTEGWFLKRASGKVFRNSLVGSFDDENIRYIIENSNIPLTVHAEFLERFIKSGLAKKTDFRIENESIYPHYNREDEEKFCSVESIIAMAEEHKAGIVFDTYHFYTYKKKLAEQENLPESKICSLSDIIEKNIVLGDKFHLSEGKNGGKRATDRHIAIYNSKGSLRLRNFLESYNFFVNPKTYMTLEINPLEKNARMIPRRVINYYAQNFIFLIDCLANNLLNYLAEKEK